MQSSAVLVFTHRDIEADIQLAAHRDKHKIQILNTYTQDKPALQVVEQYLQTASS